MVEEEEIYEMRKQANHGKEEVEDKVGEKYVEDVEMEEEEDDGLEAFVKNNGWLNEQGIPKRRWWSKTRESWRGKKWTDEEEESDDE